MLVRILSREAAALGIVIAILLGLTACGAAETGGVSSAPTAQSATISAPTTIPTQERDATVVAPTSVGTIVASHGGAVQDQVSLIDALRKAGATVTPQEMVEQPFMSVKGTRLVVNGADVQVFEYAGEAAAKLDLIQVTDVLAGRGTTMITWVASPHVYHAGRVIVLYIGDDAATLKLLQERLGAPAAEQQLPSR
jgi:hypothetical protein